MILTFYKYVKQSISFVSVAQYIEFSVRKKNFIINRQQELNQSHARVITQSLGPIHACTQSFKIKTISVLLLNFRFLLISFLRQSIVSSIFYHLFVMTLKNQNLQLLYLLLICMTTYYEVGQATISKLTPLLIYSDFTR